MHEIRIWWKVNLLTHLFPEWKAKLLLNCFCFRKTVSVLNNTLFSAAQKRVSLDGWCSTEWEPGRYGCGSRILLAIQGAQFQRLALKVVSRQNTRRQVGPALSECAKKEIGLYLKNSQNHISIRAVLFCIFALMEGFSLDYVCSDKAWPSVFFLESCFFGWGIRNFSLGTQITNSGLISQVSFQALVKTPFQRCLALHAQGGIQNKVKGSHPKCSGSQFSTWTTECLVFPKTLA